MLLICKFVSFTTCKWDITEFDYYNFQDHYKNSKSHNLLTIYFDFNFFFVKETMSMNDLQVSVLMSNETLMS